MTEARLAAYLARARTALYWVLPLVILAVIFRQVDIPRFFGILRGTNVWLLIVGILAYPATVLVGAIRWQCLLRLYFRQSVPFGFVLKHYYIGLAIGGFAPASAGWDIYRVAVAGKRLGAYGANIAVVVVEKIMAVLALIAVIVFLFPFISGRLYSDSPILPQVLQIAYTAAISLLVVAGIAMLLGQHNVVSILAKRVDAWGRMLVAKLRLTTPATINTLRTEPGFLEYVAQPFTMISPFLIISGLSVCVQAISSVSGYFMFMALGSPVPMLINLFVGPLMLFLFMLPISFGSVGIREGAYIVLYGLFGVSAETALAASLLGLIGILLNQVIGAICIWFCNHETKPDHG